MSGRVARERRQARDAWHTPTLSPCIVSACRTVGAHASKGPLLSAWLERPHRHRRPCSTIPAWPL